MAHPLRMSEDPFIEDAERIFARGKVAASIRSNRWSATPLGEIETWPPSLVCSLNLILGSATPSFIFWGPRMLQFYNDSCLPMLGSKHPQNLGKPAAECWPEAWPIIGPQLASVLDRGETVVHDHARLPWMRDGLLQDLYWNYSCSPIFDEHGAIGGILAVCHDVTAELLAVQRADEAEERLSRILDVLHEGVIVTDLHGRIVRINPAALSLTGCTPAEALAQPLHQVLRLSREQNSLAVQNILDEVQERERIDRVPQRIHNRRDRSMTLAELTGSALENGDGEFAGTVLVLHRTFTERNLSLDPYA